MPLTHSVDAEGAHVFFNTAEPQNGYLVVGSQGVEVVPKLSVPAKDSPSTVSCVLGTIQLKFGRYLVLGKTHETTGYILGHPIGKITLFEVTPLGTEISAKNSEELQYLALLKQHLDSASLFFSIDGRYDLTNSLQRLADGAKVDSRFWWNKYLSEELVAAGAEAFTAPCVYGYFKLHETTFAGKKLDFALLTRRAITRAGTRYFRRGIDEEGNVANFNETEQIVTTYAGQTFSFLQTRGSVPVYWSEINNLKYRPNLAISLRPASDAVARHFDEQVRFYGENYLVNLVNQSGYEKPVKDAYEEAVRLLPEPLAEHVKYIYFDFHHECRKMRWDRVKLLLDHLVELGYTNDNFFGIGPDQSVLSRQDRVVRTNCMDCLDRTNVVQLMLGRWTLQRQLELSGYVQNSPWEAVDPPFNWFFQGFWADNADGVSKAYSGTGALKTDYTRTGKRTKLGALQDLNNSITRYYLNNLRDGHRQDAYDLFLGNFRPARDAHVNPFVDRRAPFTQILPYIIGASFFVLVALLAYPAGSRWSWKNLLIVGGCIWFLLRNIALLVRNGVQFVNWPALVPLDFLRSADDINGTGKVVGVRYEPAENYRPLKKTN